MQAIASPAARHAEPLEVSRIVAAVHEVHRVMGGRWPAQVYREALAVEFSVRRVPYWRDVPVPASYRGLPVGHPGSADFVCATGVLVMVQDGSLLADRARTMQALGATGLPLALLVEFRGPGPRITRLRPFEGIWSSSSP